MKPFLFTIAVALLGLTRFVHADIPEIFAGQVSISAVSASAGDLGGTSRLQLTIENDSRNFYQFLGAESPAATGSSLMGKIDETRATVFDSMPILPDETLNFNTSHLWITLKSLKEPLIEGEQFPLTLRFVEGAVTVTAHVHP